MHSLLFAEMMRALDLDPTYGRYLDDTGAAALAEVNFMSLCGLHRALRGALIGQFATVELTSSPGSDRLVRGMRRMGLPDAATEFYAEHIEADAVHEQLIRLGVIGPMLATEPELAAEIVFGIRASSFLGDRFGAWLLDRWSADRSSLRTALPAGPVLGGVR
jgi:hypothetical protein